MLARRFAQVSLVVLGLLAVAAVPAANKELEEAMSADGLQKIAVKGIDVAYARPGATLAPYAKVRMSPVSVAFGKGFEPTRPGSRTKLSTEELEAIRSGVGALVQEEFAKELGKGGYAIVETAGPDVLEVRARIVDLDVSVPDAMELGRSRTYAVSAGEMTLVLELADSGTGQVLARVYDRREGRETGRLTWTTSVSNEAEARYAASTWARILRQRLDAARGIGKG